MEVQLPTGGQCLVQVGSTQYYYYINNRRRDTYFLNDGKMTKTRQEEAGYDWQGNPQYYNWQGYECINKIEYKPETNIYFQAISFSLIAFTMILLYKIIIGRFIK